MTLSSLVVSRDWPEVSVLECVLGGLHITVDVEPEPARARAKLAKSKIDALIVDCDLQGSHSFLDELENSTRTVPLVIFGSAGRRNKNASAPFVFEKPISVEQAVRTLSAARNMILDGRLRYHRQSLNLPVSVTNGSKRKLDARLLNLSQGGVGIHLHGQATLAGTVELGFALPGSKHSLKLEGEIAWTDGQGNAGIRFVEVNRRVRQNLQIWLAQQYLTQ